MADTVDSFENEIWKAVPSSEGHIEASSLGRVITIPRPRNAGQGRVATVPQRLTYGYNDNGYRVLGLKTGRKLYIHRLVCEAFHGQPPIDRPHVAHFDGNKSNNVPENLRWASCFENRQDGKRLGEIKTGEHHPGAKLNWQIVEKIRSAVNSDKLTMAAAARKYGLTPGHVRDIMTNRIWKRRIT